MNSPEVARVGLTPDEAEEQQKQVRIVKLPWATSTGHRRRVRQLVLSNSSSLGKRMRLCERTWLGHMRANCWER